MDWSGWAVGGLLATGTLTSLLIIAQMSGLTRMDLPLMLGTLLVEDPDRARVVGFVVHFVIGQAFALVYTATFAVTGNSGWLVGAALGALHAVVALALIVPLLPGIHPRMASERTGPAAGPMLEPPGLFAINYGRQTVLATVVAHVGYGIALGLIVGSR